MTANKKKELIFLIIPLLIAVLIMMPRLISPQFGLLDDGTMLVKVKEISQGNFKMSDDLQAGRFRPLYWLYFTIIYILAGMNPFWFFFSHLFLFLIILIQIRLLMKHMKAENWQILIASLIFIFSMPIIENFYTLSKPEPLQLVFLLSSLLCLEKLKNTNTKKVWWLISILSFFFVLSAIMVKETAIAMAPMIVLWTGYIYWNGKNSFQREKRAFTIYLCSVLAAIIIYFILRCFWGTASLTGGTYTERYTFSIALILAKSTRWVTLFAYYFHYLIPLIVITAIILLKTNITNIHLKFQLCFWGIWVILWVIVLLPWGFAEIYYLLPFSLGVSIFLGLLSPILINYIKHNMHMIQKGIVTILLIMTTTLIIATFRNYRTHALTQLAFDKTNHQMLVHVVEIIPENGNVFIGIDKEKEYIHNIRQFLMDHYGRSDITYEFISVEMLERLHWYPDGVVIMPHVSNLPDLVVRAGIDEFYTMLWSEIIQYTMEGRLIELTKIRSEFQLSNVNLPVILCPILGEAGFCKDPDPIFDARIFNYGWDIYKIH